MDWEQRGFHMKMEKKRKDKEFPPFSFIPHVVQAASGSGFFHWMKKKHAELFNLM